MQQVKFFKGVESELHELEAEVNQWLADNDVRVVNLLGNIAPQTPTPDATSISAHGTFAPSDILMVLLYETD